MCLRHQNRKGFVLAELLVAVAILTIVAALALGAWTRSQEAGALRQAQMQTAAVMRDAIARAIQAGPGGAAGVAYTNASTLGEWQLISGTWQAVQPAGGIPLALPAGVTVGWSFNQTGLQSWPYGSTTMLVQVGETDTGTYEGFSTITAPGFVTLTSSHGMTAVVHVTGAGTVWY